ncbi:MAG: molecular chaperone DnaK, partial [Planctomycetota bacterium]|nr:molecular chaperone DnaK [Planctomycetota bacterium]
AVTKLREVAGGEDLEGINSAVKDLEQAQQAWSKVLYEKAAAEGETEAPAGDAAAPDADDDAIDAEFEVKKD